MNEPLEDNKSEDEILVTQLYHRAEQQEPDQELDNAILAMAKKHAKLTPHSLPKKPLPWWKKMQYQGAVAASVVLVSFVFILQPQSPEILLQEPSLARSPAIPSMQSPNEMPENSLFLSSEGNKMGRTAAKTEVKSSRYRATEAEAENPVEMTTAEMTDSNMALADNLQDSSQKPVRGLAESRLIMQGLLAIQASLKLDHGEIMLLKESPAAKNKRANFNLGSDYQTRHKTLLENLAKVLADTADESILVNYQAVLSVQDIQTLKNAMN